MNTEPAAIPLALPKTKREQTYSLVLISGLTTTALALLGVYLLDRFTDEFHIMGWYANRILPAGALLVGLAASSGYSIASWTTGIKITRKLLVWVLVLQCAAYFAAKYIEFAQLELFYLKTNKPVGFFEYFDAMARSFAWKQHDGSSGEALGLWGYCFRLLEIVGFAGGSLVVPALLRKVAYCADCHRYMQSRELGRIPASVRARKVKKSDTAGQATHQAEHQHALETGKQTLTALGELASTGKTDEFQKAINDLAAGKREAGKVPVRLSVHLVHCKRCFSGWLLANLTTESGNGITTQEFSKTDLQPEFIRSVAK